jgi:hypothetical protein
MDGRQMLHLNLAIALKLLHCGGRREICREVENRFSRHFRIDDRVAACHGSREHVPAICNVSSNGVESSRGAYFCRRNGLRQSQRTDERKQDGEQGMMAISTAITSEHGQHDITWARWQRARIVSTKQALALS